MMLSHEGQVALARCHVEKGRDIISRQHRLIERKRVKGFDTMISASFCSCSRRHKPSLKVI